MSVPFGSFPFSSAGIDSFAWPQFLSPNLRAPTSNDIQNPGTRWMDSSVNPPVIYETTGAGNWNQAGGGPATTSTFGTVKLSTLLQLETASDTSVTVVPLANDVFAFVNSIVVGAGTPATTAAQGYV